MDKQPIEKSQAEQNLDKLLTMEGAFELVGFFEVLMEVDRDLKFNKQSNEL